MYSRFYGSNLQYYIRYEIHVHVWLLHVWMNYHKSPMNMVVSHKWRQMLLCCLHFYVFIFKNEHTTCTFFSNWRQMRLCQETCSNIALFSYFHTLCLVLLDFIWEVISSVIFECFVKNRSTGSCLYIYASSLKLHGFVKQNYDWPYIPHVSAFCLQCILGYLKLVVKLVFLTW